MLVRDDAEKAQLKKTLKERYGKRAANGIIILTIHECKGLEFKVELHRWL